MWAFVDQVSRQETAEAVPRRIRRPYVHVQLTLRPPRALGRCRCPGLGRPLRVGSCPRPARRLPPVVRTPLLPRPPGRRAPPEWLAQAIEPTNGVVDQIDMTMADLTRPDSPKA